jgi:hypothetical protein
MDSGNLGREQLGGPVTPPGWYPDPAAPGGYLWWTGQEWVNPFSWPPYQPPRRMWGVRPTWPPPVMSRRKRSLWLIFALGCAVGFMVAYAALVACLAATRPLPGSTYSFELAFLVTNLLFVRAMPEIRRAANVQGIPPAAGSQLPKQRAGRFWRWRASGLLAVLPPRLARVLRVAQYIAVLLVALGWGAALGSAVSSGMSAGVTVMWWQRCFASVVAWQFATLSVLALCMWRTWRTQEITEPAGDHVAPLA